MKPFGDIEVVYTHRCKIFTDTEKYGSMFMSLSG